MPLIRLSTIFLLLNLVTFTTSVDAQSPSDSIEFNGSLTSTEKVDNLHNLAQNLIGVDHEVALLYLDEASQLASKEKYIKGIADNYAKRGLIHYYDDEYSLAITSFENALDEYKHQDQSIFEISECYFYISLAYNQMGSFEKTMEYAIKSLEMKKSIGDDIGISSVYNHFGSIYRIQKNYQTALEYYYKALKIKEEIGDRKGLATSYNNIGIVFDLRGYPEKAGQYYEQALEIRMEIGDIRRIAQSKFTIGRFLHNQGKLEESLKMYSDALEIYEKLNEKLGAALIHIKLAWLYNDLNVQDRALSELDMGLTVGEELNNLQLMADSYNLLSKIYAAKEDYHKSYEYLGKFKKINDSIFMNERDRVIAEIEYKYQTEQKDHDIALLQSRNKVITQRTLIMLISAIALFLILSMLFVFARSKGRTLKQQNEILEKEKLLQIKEADFKDKEKQHLEDQLELKNKEVASKALSLLQHNETLRQIIHKLELLDQKLEPGNKNVKKELSNIIHDLEINLKHSAWNDFDKAFRQVNNEFYDKLLEYCPDLTPAEIKLAALLKLNLSTKEIEAITFKSESGIKSTRHRLRKKLNLATDSNLSTFLMQL